MVAKRLFEMSEGLFYVYLQNEIVMIMKWLLRL